MPSFIVPAIPVAQPRQRSALIAGRVRNYTPAGHAVNAFKAACQLSLAQSCPGWLPCAEPVWLRLLFVFGLPLSKSRKRDRGLRRRHGTRPDVDNLAKSVMDALNGLAWADDKLVYSLEVRKCYAGRNENPHVEVDFGSCTDEQALQAFEDV